jgi:hypothetical protein
MIYFAYCGFSQAPGRRSPPAGGVPRRGWPDIIRGNAHCQYTRSVLFISGTPTAWLAAAPWRHRRSSLARVGPVRAAVTVEPRSLLAEDSDGSS